MYQPSKVVLATCIRGLLCLKKQTKENIERDKIVNLFPLDCLLCYIFNCFAQVINSWDKSVSQKNIEGNEEVKYFYFETFNIYVIVIIQYLKKSRTLTIF